MITYEDMLQLFKLIANYSEEDIVCYAFGGNAMMAYGYKSSTKDVDLIFEDEKSRDIFIKAIERLGYIKKSVNLAFPTLPNKRGSKPVMYTRGEERFDLFVGDIFGIKIENMKNRHYARYDFLIDKSITVYIMAKEDIILLKSVTERENDFNDILTILRKDGISWEKILEEIEWQANKGDRMIVYLIEETMQRLKDKVFIKQKYFDMIHGLG